MDGLVAQLGVSGVIALCGVIGTFYVMRSRIEDLIERDNKQTREMAAVWKKIEGISEDVSLHNQKLGVIGSMMSPEAVEKHHKWSASVEKDIEYLRRDLTRIDDRTQCKECKS